MIWGGFIYIVYKNNSRLAYSFALCSDLLKKLTIKNIDIWAKKKGIDIISVADFTHLERFKEIKKEALESGLAEENILFIENPKEIFEKIKTFCQPGDIVLLESRVPGELIQQLTIDNESF